MFPGLRYMGYKEVRGVPTEKKAEAIASLVDQLKASRALVLTDYRGLPTPELNALRVRLKEAGGEYQIV